MNYKEALHYLFSINQSEKIKLGLERIQALLDSLGNPEKAFKSIHIAGTNGKGSVSTKIATALQHAGKKVGLYTSPHISSFRERIQINGILISEDDVALHLSKILELDIKPTFFETTTLLAFLYFANTRVDYAVIETGLGGRKDATNCITPQVSIITSIAEDHTEILGNTLEAIAIEKGGIIKEHVPVIIGPKVPLKTIASIAAQKKSPLTRVLGNFLTFDEENSALAKTTLESLQIPRHAIIKGCLARPPCRIETIQTVPFPIILDVAHNPNGLNTLFKSLHHLYPNTQFSALIGLSDSKDIDSCLNVLIDHASHIYLVQAKHRGTPTSLLVSRLDHLGFQNYTECTSIEEALHKNQEPLVITGTFFIMDEARQALKLSYPTDPFELNETSFTLAQNKRFG